MSQAVQRAIGELQRLTLEALLKLLGYFVKLLSVSLAAQRPAAEKSAVDSVGIDALLAETRGSWGRLSIEEIDAELKRQRQIDWGE